MSFSLVHLSDLHFGGVSDVPQVEAFESLLPDLEPRVVVITGDITQRARHGEFQRARAFVRELERTAPVYLIPGNHDAQWWLRPLIPFGSAVKYAKYRSYFGPVLVPTLELPEAVIAGALTSYGVAWGSLSGARDIAVKGHLPKREILKVKRIFTKAHPAKARILVLHHNVLRGKLSRRMGLARWRRAQRRIVGSGADLVLCGHDHQEDLAMLDGQPVIACAGTMSTRSRGGRPSVFFRITVEHDAIHAELYRWESDRRLFRRSDQYAFARRRVFSEAKVGSAVG